MIGPVSLGDKGGRALAVFLRQDLTRGGRDDINNRAGHPLFAISTRQCACARYRALLIRGAPNARAQTDKRRERFPRACQVSSYEMYTQSALAGHPCRRCSA